MDAVIIAGGKQYKVQKNHFVLVEKQNVELGGQIEFTNVLLASDGEKSFVGEPYLKNCTVKATVEAHGKHDKIKILKFRRRKHHMKRMGHRQLFTKLRINDIHFSN